MMADKPASSPASSTENAINETKSDNDDYTAQVLQTIQKRQRNHLISNPAGTTSNVSNKRKPDHSDSTAVQPQSIQKRQKNTVIDDPTAITFLKELGLDQQFFDDGKVLAWRLQPDDPDFLRIHKYVERGQDHGIGVKIQYILKVIPSVHTLAQDPNSYLDFKNDPNAVGMKRMMLWYGTKRQHVKSILENGMKLPKHEGSYGLGIYFADMVYTSCTYTDYCVSQSNPQIGQVGYLFLSDVLLGNIYKAYGPMPYLTKPPPMDVTPWWKMWGEEEYVDRQSVMGTDCNGGYGPDSTGDVKIDGCTWPLGYPQGTGFQHNEYIVYDEKQVKPKFLVKFEYTRKPYHYKCE